MNKWIVFVGTALGIFFFTLVNVHGQDVPWALADEYFQAGAYEKARVTYENYLKDKSAFEKIHASYLECLYKTNREKEIGKYLKSKIKEYPDFVDLRLDQYFFQKKSEKDLVKLKTKLVQQLAENDRWVLLAQKYLEKTSENELAIDIYLESRKNLGEPYKYALELAALYKKTGQTETLVKEAVAYLLHESQNVDVIKSKLQNYMDTPKEWEAMESKLLEKVQEEPNNTLLVDILIWLYNQKRDFEEAFLQAKAYDLRFKTWGAKCMEVGTIAMQNHQYLTAIDIFNYITSQYKQTSNYFTARKNKIWCQEQQIKSTYPVDKKEVLSLIEQYKNYGAEVGQGNDYFESQSNIAHLLAFYLDKKDTALSIMDAMLHLPRIDNDLRDRAKLEMADIYVLQNELDESALLYGQVEKDRKDEPLGHEAKLRNAKLSYYKGEFLWAQEQLDVLKLATSREIANDALYLSLFIQNALAEDTNTRVLSSFSEAELLIFQHQYEKAEKILDQLFASYPQHTVSEYILWQKAILSGKKSNHLEKIKWLQFIQKDFHDGLLADDALYEQGVTYEEKLNDTSKAKELYFSLLEKYPGSIFTQEARKRYRALRGDKIN